MEAYVQAFNHGTTQLPSNCDLTGVYGRIKHGLDDEFNRLSHDPNKRFSWVFDHEKLRTFLGMTHLDMLLNVGHTIEWIRYEMDRDRKFKLILFTATSDEVKLATWDNVFELLTIHYPEVDSSIWLRYANELKTMTFDEIDPERTIVKNYYAGHHSEQFMHLTRFLSLPNLPTLWEVRAFLHNQIGLNEIFRGDGRTSSHDGTVLDNEYLVGNRYLSEFKQYALLDLNPTRP